MICPPAELAADAGREVNRIVADEVAKAGSENAV